VVFEFIRASDKVFSFIALQGKRLNLKKKKKLHYRVSF